MKNKFTILLLVLFCIELSAQIQNIQSKYNLSNTVSETSGLVFFNNKLITHNDSGDGPKLYELDTVSGNVSRTITISNATHVDWEDITQDDNYLYVGDFGNNNGNRQDLKIYRVLKSDYINNTNVTADIISFSYEDQVDFTSNPYNHDFDAEAISVYQNELILFSKNWNSSTVKAYSIPKSIGNHSAKKIGTYNSNGLITGATYNAEDNSFLLCGYHKDGNPILWYLQNIDIQNIFSGNIERTDITASIGLASQIEGITHISGEKYFLSREKVDRTINGTPVFLNQHLFRFDNGSFIALNIDNHIKKKLIIYPNPTSEILHFKIDNITQIQIFNSTGKLFKTQKNSNNQIRIKEFPAGAYVIQITLLNKAIISKRFIKY